LYKKGVICLGQAFYDISGLTYNIRDLDKLEDTIKEAIKYEKSDDETIRRFVNAVLHSIKKGRVTPQFGTYTEYLSEANLKLVAQGTIDEFKLHG